MRIFGCLVFRISSNGCCRLSKAGFSPQRRDLGIRSDPSIPRNQTPPVMTNGGHDHLISRISMKGLRKSTALQKDVWSQLGDKEAGCSQC